MLRFFLIGSGIFLAMGAMVLLFFIGLALSARRTYNTLLEVLTLRINYMQQGVKLQEREEILRSTLSSMDDLVFTLDANGVFLEYLQSRDKHELFVAPEMFVGKPYSEVLPSHIAKALERAISKVERTESVEQFVYPLNIDGEEYWFSAKVSMRKKGKSEYDGFTIVARDITESKLAEKALQESEEKYRNVVERSNDGIAVIQNWKIIYANKRLAEIIGYSIKEIENTQFTDYIHPDELPVFLENYEWRRAEEDVPMIYNTVLRYRDGNKIYVESNVGIVTYQGKPAELAFIRNITERKKIEEELRESEVRFRKLSITDPLTEIYNRRYFFERIKEKIEQVKRNKENFSIVILDIDFFKKINDKYGHQAGDYILKEFASRMKMDIRPYDVLARFGGEEFAIMLQNSDKENSRRIIQRIKENIDSTAFIFENKKIKIKFSGGISDVNELGPNGLTLEELIRIADNRLYFAKKSGRNQIIDSG